MSTFLIFLLIIIVGIVASFLNSPKSIGREGEKYVSGRFLSELNPENYILIDDVMLKNDSDIGTTQIDHIVVSNFGIFCVETKAYAGWIFGKASDKYWTQSVNYNKYRFFNPLRQNYGHVKTLEKLLVSIGISAPIYSFVAFPDAEELKITGTDVVGYAGEIIDKIKEHTEIKLSNEDVEKIINIIDQANITDKNVRKEHVRKINELRDAPPSVWHKNRHKYREDNDDYDCNDF